MTTRVAFHLTDRCQLRCRDCHWFVAPVTESPEVPAAVWCTWLRLHAREVATLRITGGEPTLHAGWAEVALAAAALVGRVELFTNAVDVDSLERWAERHAEKRLPQVVVVIVNFTPPRVASPEQAARLLAIGAAVGRLETRWIGLKNQVADADISLVGERVVCAPTSIRFGADGMVYQCEAGMRAKARELMTGDTLWTDAFPAMCAWKCQARPECPSAFAGHEQTFASVRS